MSADVAGYSRLMGLDENGTLKRLSDLRSTVDALIVQRGGSIAGKDVGELALKNITQPVQAFQLLGVQRVDERTEAEAPSTISGLRWPFGRALRWQKGRLP